MIQTVLLVLLAAALAGALWALSVLRRRLAESEAEAQARAAEAAALREQLQAREQQVWQAANTIDLYAALAEEQTPVQTLHHKLSAIRQAARTLLERPM